MGAIAQYLHDLLYGVVGIVNDTNDDVTEIEHHIHNFERWFGAAAVPDGELHVADRAEDGVSPFSVDAGNDAFGSWVQILGSDDTPDTVGMTKYDPHRVYIESVEENDHHIMQIAFGNVAADAYAAGDYTELVFMPSGAGGQIDNGPVDMMSERIDSGTKAWARVYAPGKNTSLITFFVGIHEYAE